MWNEINAGLEHDFGEYRTESNRTPDSIKLKGKEACVYSADLQILNLEGFYYSLLRVQHSFLHIAVYPSRTMAITDLAS